MKRWGGPFGTKESGHVLGIIDYAVCFKLYCVRNLLLEFFWDFDEDKYAICYAGWNNFSQ